MDTPKNTAPNTISPERAPTLTGPLPFFLTALLFLAALLVLSVWQAPYLAGHYLQNSATLTVTHLFTLGFGGLVVPGAVYQMTPVLLYSDPPSGRLTSLHLMLQTAGTILMVTGFLGYGTLWLMVGGSFVAASGVVFLVNVVPMFRAATRWNWHGVLMATAICFYFTTISWGLVLALNLRYHFMGGDPRVALSAHLALGLAGWFSLMIVGAGLKLLPMFAPAKALPNRFVAAVGGTLVLGVVTFLVGLSLGPGWLWPGALLMTTAALGYGGGVAYSFMHRRPGPLDFSVRFALTAAAFVAVIALAAFTGMAGLWTSEEAAASLTVLFALAWIGGTILGMLLRILPFMVWLHRFRNRPDKQAKLPFLHEMFHPALGWTTYLCWFPGSLVMSMGFAFASDLLLRAGALLCLVGVTAFGWAIGQVLYHVPPGKPALYPGRRPL